MDTNKLASILAKSKKVMNKTDEMQNAGKITQGGNGSAPNMPTVGGYNINENHNRIWAPQQAIKHTFANKDTTKMPREIVEAMINNPIEVPSHGSFESSPELIDAVRKAEGNPRQRQSQTTKTDIDGIREIIREELENVIDSYIDKRLLNEEIQVKVGNTIFSGNLKPLPKRKKKR